MKTEALCEPLICTFHYVFLAPAGHLNTFSLLGSFESEAEVGHLGHTKLKICPVVCVRFVNSKQATSDFFLISILLECTYRVNTSKATTSPYLLPVPIKTTAELSTRAIEGLKEVASVRWHIQLQHSTCPAFSFSWILWVGKLAWPGIQEYINEIHRKQAVREERLGKQPCLLLTSSIWPLHLEQHGKKLWPILSESILLHPG